MYIKLQIDLKNIFIHTKTKEAASTPPKNNCYNKKNADKKKEEG